MIPLILYFYRRSFWANSTVIMMLFLISCKNNSNSTKEISTDSIVKIMQDDSNFDFDAELHDFVATSDEYAAIIKDIRENFNRINSIKNWDAIDEKEIMETTEGGWAFYYKKNGVLHKIIAKEYGETFQSTTEYYFKNDKIIFIYNKQLLYNQPFYIDSTSAREMGLDEWFDIHKSMIHESRNYFHNGKLIHQIFMPSEEIFITDSIRKVNETVYLNEIERLLSY